MLLGAGMFDEVDTTSCGCWGAEGENVEASGDSDGKPDCILAAVVTVEAPEPVEGVDPAEAVVTG